MAIEEGPVRVEPMEEGAYWRIILGSSKGNIIDMAMMENLTDVFQKAKKARELRAVCVEGEGKHFSFGASVPEHLPEQVNRMLPGFHELFRVMADSHVVLMAAVRGQCLGGGLELASFCHRVFATKDAMLGQPEIVLGVFPPMASFILPERIGRANAEDLCLSGRILQADEAHRMGLVDEIADDPGVRALEWAKSHLLRHSAVSVRHGVKAIRANLRARMDSELNEIERIYLDELMKTHDAAEGLQAFLEKRKPQWKNE